MDIKFKLEAEEPIIYKFADIPVEFVPYTGAFKDVNLWPHSISAWNGYFGNIYTKTESDAILLDYYTSAQVDAKLSDLHNPVTIWTWNWLSILGQVLSLWLATNSINGALSSADWNTFNSKQNALWFTPENVANRWVANWYASLDSWWKVPMAQLPTSIMEYKGAWNALTNTPTLADWTGDTWDTYRTSVEWTQNLWSWAIKFYIGDFVIYNGTIRERSPTANWVVSVFWRTWAISAQSGDYTADQITESLTRVFVTPAEKIAITHTNRSYLDLVSWTNTGDETQSSIKTKLWVASAWVDWYLSWSDWNLFNSKQPAWSYINSDWSNSNIDTLVFDETPASVDALNPWEMRWNSTDWTMDLGMPFGVMQQIWQELFIKCINKTGSTLPNGSPVYFSGRQWNRPKALLASSDSDSTSKVVWILTQDILNDDEWFVTILWYVRQIKTNYSWAGDRWTTWAEWDLLYVSKTVAWQLTNIEPSAPHHSDIVWTVAIVWGAWIGSILVNIQRHKTLEELSDINWTPLTLDWQFPVWNNIWKYFDFTSKISDFLKIDQTTPQTVINWVPVFQQWIQAWTARIWWPVNYSSFEADWTYVANGDASCYRDEYPAILVPASWATAPDSVGATIWWVARQMYAFDWGATQERLSWSFEIPHDYMYWSVIEIHVHWRPNTTWSWAVKRFFDWEHSPAQLWPSAQTTISVVDTVVASTQYYHHIISLWVLPNLWYQIWDKIWFNLRRTPSDAQDTYAWDALLEQIAMHVQVDTLWSRARYSK